MFEEEEGDLVRDGGLRSMTNSKSCVAPKVLDVGRWTFGCLRRRRRERTRQDGAGPVCWIINYKCARFAPSQGLLGAGWCSSLGWCGRWRGMRRGHI